jgi:hypothetical protein
LFSSESDVHSQSSPTHSLSLYHEQCGLPCACGSISYHILNTCIFHEMYMKQRRERERERERETKDEAIVDRLITCALQVKGGVRKGGL